MAPGAGGGRGGVDLVGGERDAQRAGVRGRLRSVLGAGDGHDAPLDEPAQGDLRGAGVVAAGDLDEQGEGGLERGKPADAELGSSRRIPPGR